MTCELLGVPFSDAKSADELTEADRYVAYVISEARAMARTATDKKR